MNRWRVQKIGGSWRVLDYGTWHDTFDTLPEAHTYATQLAVADELFNPGGLTFLNSLKTAYVMQMRYAINDGVR